MKVIIVGCGRMGSGLALELASKNVDVIVIDTHAEAFKLLGPDFKGRTIVGVGFDQDVLADAKISQVDGVVSCTNNDETNALIARIAQNIFRVPKVVARLYDPRKADIYHNLGIQTISTTTFGIQKAVDLLNYGQLDIQISIGDGKVDIVRVEVPLLLTGRTVNELTVLSEMQVVAIKREDSTFIPTLGTTLKNHDILYIAVLNTAQAQLLKLLGLESV